MKALALFLVVLIGLSTTLAASPQDATQIVPLVMIPLSGPKTLLRFVVMNTGETPAIVYGPFANETRLIVTYPDGHKKEHFNWKSMPGPPEPLAQKKTIQWDIDIVQWVEFNEKGTYSISFTVNGKESNQLTLVKD